MILVNPRIEHCDPDDDSQSVLVEIIDESGNISQLFFTDMGAQAEFLQDLKSVGVQTLQNKGVIPNDSSEGHAIKRSCTLIKGTATIH